MSTFVGFYAKKRSTFVGFHAKKRSTFEELYAKQKKRSTFVGFHAKKRSTFEKFTLNQKKGPLLSNFTLKKVQFFQIVRVEMCLLIHIPDLDQFKGGQCPPCPPYKKNPVFSIYEAHKCFNKDFLFLTHTFITNALLLFFLDHAA